MSLRELIEDFPGAAATVLQITYVWGEPVEIVQFSDDSIAVSWYLPPTSNHEQEAVRTVIIAKNGGVVDWSLKNQEELNSLLPAPEKLTVTSQTLNTGTVAGVAEQSQCNPSSPLSW